MPPSFCFYLVRSARLSPVLCLCLPVLTVLSLCFLSWSHIHTYTYTYTQVEGGFTWPCTHALATHTYTRGIVERCAYVHEARARVPRSTHLFLSSSVRDTRRYLATEATATVRRHARVYRNHPAFRRYSVHSASCDSSAIPFLLLWERRKRERERDQE